MRLLELPAKPIWFGPPTRRVYGQPLDPVTFACSSSEAAIALPVHDQKHRTGFRIATAELPELRVGYLRLEVARSHRAYGAMHADPG